MTGSETVQKLEDQYGKILAVVMRKHRLGHIVINENDILQANKGGLNIVVQELEDGLHVKVVGDDEARRLQSLENKFNPPKKGGD